ncbi:MULTISPECIES: SDR family NAD(P)-dependent oxidoreductase [unclassified Rhodococcus (in: high G+C Gram-positive bacteria)]|uniref:SDR family NAD(P)-dependent oxidoreductase n=1 Tax=unclassified Rhodococcus (in: high G+C Gram-positive bacteria) TaxID=192944 RepID=UPI0028A06942|nr:MULTISPECIES: SDR family NAD(P)-dependent oxidoreductase [unclassified Rhodococcus (in: high G+C Gram-positive bacteria)]
MACPASQCPNSPARPHPTTHRKRRHARSSPPGHRHPRADDRQADRGVAFVSGGTRGIGGAIARSLAHQGATVAVGYSRNPAAADQFAADLSRTCRQFGASASAHQGNVGSAADCRRTIAEVVDTHGRLDILINNAGITIDKTVTELTDDDWSTVLAVNLSGAFFLSQAALAHMLDRGTGRIVNVSSVVGETGNIGQANYAASKSGLFGLTKTLAKEAAFTLAKSCCPSADRSPCSRGD